MKKKNKKAAKKTKEDTPEEAKDELKVDTNEGSQAAPVEESPDDAEAVASGQEKATEDEKQDGASPSTTPSLAQQSKLRSTSFRAGSVSGPLSPGPFSPDGDTAPDIYRKHVARIEELEKENKRLSKESAESEKRWKKAEEELADLREAEGDEASAQTSSNSQAEKMVRIERTSCPCRLKANRNAEGGDCLSSTTKFPASTTGCTRLRSWPSPLHVYEHAAFRARSRTRLKVSDNRIHGGRNL